MRHMITQVGNMEHGPMHELSPCHYGAHRLGGDRIDAHEIVYIEAADAHHVPSGLSLVVHMHCRGPPSNCQPLQLT